MRKLVESNFNVGDEVAFHHGGSEFTYATVTATSDADYTVEWDDGEVGTIGKDDANLMSVEDADNMIDSEGSMNESWQDKYDDFEDFEYEVTSTIENDLEYDPIPSEIEVYDLISNLGISMEAEQSIIDISVVDPEYYCNEVTFDEDGDPDVATVGFQIRYHIKTKDRASAQEIAYAFDDIPINLLEYGLSGHYYTRGTIEIDEWSVTEMGKGKNAVSLYIQGGMDLNVYEFM